MMSNPVTRDERHKRYGRASESPANSLPFLNDFSPESSKWISFQAGLLARFIPDTFPYRNGYSGELSGNWIVLGFVFSVLSYYSPEPQTLNSTLETIPKLTATGIAPDLHRCSLLIRYLEVPKPKTSAKVGKIKMLTRYFSESALGNGIEV